MTASVLGRKIRGVIAAAALDVAVTGCIGNLGAAASEKPDGSGQLRCFGGPKSSM